MMKKVFFAAFVLLIVMGFAACSNKQVPVSTVNLQLQNSVDSLLKQGMGEWRYGRYGNCGGDIDW